MLSQEDISAEDMAALEATETLYLKQACSGNGPSDVTGLGGVDQNQNPNQPATCGGTGQAQGGVAGPIHRGPNQTARFNPYGASPSHGAGQQQQQQQQQQPRGNTTPQRQNAGNATIGQAGQDATPQRPNSDRLQGVGAGERTAPQFGAQNARMRSGGMVEAAGSVSAHHPPQHQQGITAPGNPPAVVARAAESHNHASEGPARPVEVSASCSFLGGAPLPSIQGFLDYQGCVSQILDRSDYETMGGKRIIKRSGYRKLALAFNVSFETRSEVIERDERGNVLFAKFIVVHDPPQLFESKCRWIFMKHTLCGSPDVKRFVQRAIMPDGRFSDGWGGCTPVEKRFAKPNHDVPATAETRAKNRACSDLFGIGESKR